MHKAPMIATGIAALGLLMAPAANAAGMETPPKTDDGNSSAVANGSGDTNVSQGNKCIIIVVSQEPPTENGLVPSLIRMLLGSPKKSSSEEGKTEQEAQTTNNIQCNVGNISDNHPNK